MPDKGLGVQHEGRELGKGSGVGDGEFAAEVQRARAAAVKEQEVNAVSTSARL